jgi:hypothetical protein
MIRMRLSAKKAVYADPSGAAYRKSGAVLGLPISRKIDLGTQDYILDNCQPSLAGLDLVLNSTQHCVLGYFQPDLSKLVFVGGRGNPHVCGRNSRSLHYASLWSG